MKVEDPISKSRQLAEQLDDMPMFHFMLAGRELFHSNFISWIFKKKPSEICSLFNLSDEVPLVEREKNNVDLTITQGKNQILIENKFKSLIDDEQLERYSISAARRTNHTLNQRFVILSPDILSREELQSRRLVPFAENTHKLVPSTWEYMYFGNLTQHLHPSTDSYVRDYVSMTNSVLEFLKMVNVWENGRRIYWFNEDEFEESDRIAGVIRLHDMLQKRRAQKLASHLFQALKPKYGVSLNVRCGFTRKQPLAEAFLDMKDNDLAIGIQIQGNQYRRCLLIPRNKAKTSKESVTNHPVGGMLIEKGWFRTGSDQKFKGGHFQGITGGSTPRRAHFQKFGDVFQYQYTTIGGTALSPSLLIDAVKADLEFAKELVGLA